MKAKHNKKRNTAFVYEALINEATVCVLKNEHEKSKKVVDLIRKHFTSDSNLKKDLECYKSLYENQNIDTDMSQRILKEATMNAEDVAKSVITIFKLPLDTNILNLTIMANKMPFVGRG